jgi:hypothetical protein
MSSKAARRQLSTGDVMVFTLALTSIIVVSGDNASRLASQDAGLWASAQGLVAAGQAREFQGADLAQIAHELRDLALLTGSGGWPL